MSELIRWFEKRKETRAIGHVQSHLALTTGIIEDLEKAIRAANEGKGDEMQTYVRRVASSEREADSIRRKVMDEVSRGELAPTDREGLLELVKRVDMVADWNRESTRILDAIPTQHVPESIKAAFIEMVMSAKACTKLLQQCIDKMIKTPNEALKAADAVEREEEHVDEIHEKARALLGEEDLPKAGVAVLIGQMFEALEMIADSCEDAGDQVRILMVRE